MTELNLSARASGPDFSHIKDAIFPTATIGNGWWAINASVISGFIIVFAIVIVAVILRLTVIRKWKVVPTAGQMFLEYIVTFFDKSAKDNTEEFSVFMGPYTMGAACYICFGVLIELVGLRPAVADISACLALALSTFVCIHSFGFARNKYKRMIHYVNPINVVTDIAVPVSLTFRLFGSVLSGLVIMELIYIVITPLAMWILPLGLPAALSPLFTLFHAFIQAYIFAVLSNIFVQEAIEHVASSPKRVKRKEIKRSI